MPTHDRFAALRERMAYEAARIILDQGASTFDHARRKAAERIGVTDRRHWPSNEAIQEAVLSQRRLFPGGLDQTVLRRFRAAALEAMDWLEPFAPRLIGDTLSGALNPTSGIELLLFADRAEDVILTLMELRIPWREGERLFNYGSGQRRAHPLLRFIAGDVRVELIILPLQARRHPPLDHISERPLRGASRDAVARLLETEP
ncbi:MAG: hypothetical protein EOM91_04905 [Sphingobacteriia bacterium]|nr:hypothetical protein [Sphingobacteriia bacterium]NCC38720.1 hypothetical protein [Gammaproteobacteria bacterium]